eukprot:349883-Chlamydomonas_euryale.AAC.1
MIYSPPRPKHAHTGCSPSGGHLQRADTGWFHRRECGRGGRCGAGGWRCCGSLCRRVDGCVHTHMHTLPRAPRNPRRDVLQIARPVGGVWERGSARTLARPHLGSLGVKGSARLDACTAWPGGLQEKGSARLDACTAWPGGLREEGSARLDARTSMGSVRGKPQGKFVSAWPTRCSGKHNFKPCVWLVVLRVTVCTESFGASSRPVGQTRCSEGTSSLRVCM